MKKITIYAKTIKNQNFLEYSYMNKKGTYYKVKFTMKCNQYPKEAGYWSCELPDDGASIEKGKITKEGYNIPATLWIHEISKFVRDEEAEKRAVENGKKALAEAFDEETEDDNLPF